MPSYINLEVDDESQHLDVTIITERLHMESVTLLHLGDYANLFMSAENMALFASGQPWDAETAKARLKVWIDRFDANDPFSSLAVSIRDTDEFIGHVVLGYGDNKGEAELAYIFDKKFWRKGYGTEAVVPVVTEYAPELIKRNYKIGKNDFTAITATAHAKNIGSIRILEKSGMEKKSADERRCRFFANIPDLVQRFQDNQPAHKENSAGANNNPNDIPKFNIK